MHAQTPTQRREPELLWTQAQEDLNQKRSESAHARLVRLIERYPADPHALEARPILARLALEQKKTPEAMEHLVFFVRAQPRLLTPEARAPYVQARLTLGDLYLESHQPAQALTTVQDLAVTDASASLTAAGLTANDQLHGLVIQAEAFEQRSLRTDTDRSLAQIRLLPAWTTLDPLLIARMSRIETRASLRTCAQMIDSKVLITLDEGQQIAVLDRAGLCIQESLIPAALRYPEVVAPALQALSSYRMRCSQPIAPARLTMPEKKRYATDLTPRLKTTCNPRLEPIQQILKNQNQAFLQPLIQESRPL